MKSYLKTSLPFFLALLSCLLWTTQYSQESALMNDASAYFSEALKILNFEKREGFVDVGYPAILSLLFYIFGKSFFYAQVLNAVLWGLSSTLIYLILQLKIKKNQALFFSSIAALSPVLTSFAPKLYSEHLAIFCFLVFGYTWLRLSDPVHLFWKKRWVWFFYLSSLTLLVITKSAFFLMLPFLGGYYLLIKRYDFLLALALVLILVLPIQKQSQQGGRGIVVAAFQTLRLEIWPKPLVLKCGVYNLSNSLGVKVFPEVEGACDLFRYSATKPMSHLNPGLFLFQKVKSGFSYSDAFHLIFTYPLKYFLLCLANLMSAVWLEGVYAPAIEGAGHTTKTILWIVFKVIYSSFLWVVFLRGCFLLFKKGRLKEFMPLLFPSFFLLLFHANVHGEQRYFFFLIPIFSLFVGMFFSGGFQKKHL